METVDRVLSLIDEAHLARYIDRPVEEAVATFRCEVEKPKSHSEFLDVASSFVQHLLRQAPVCPRQLTLSQARDEAVALVKLAYRPVSTVAYEAALCEAFDQSTPGMKCVLDRLCETFRGRCRESYCVSVFTRHIDTCDWQTRCEIVRVLLEQYLGDLPSSPHGAELCPQMLVDDIPDLVHTAIAVRQAGQDAYAGTFLNSG